MILSKLNRIPCMYGKSLSIRKVFTKHVTELEEKGWTAVSFLPDIRKLFAELCRELKLEVDIYGRPYKVQHPNGAFDSYSSYYFFVRGKSNEIRLKYLEAFNLVKVHMV